MEKIVRYYSDGKTVHETYTVDAKGVRQGPFESYYKNGQLEAKCTYKDDKYNGPFEAYYENGALASKGAFKDDLLNGPCEGYDKKGQLKIKSTFENGIEQGPYEEYGKNGKLVRKGRHQNGKFIDETADASEHSKLTDMLKQVEQNTKIAASREKHPEKGAKRVPSKPKGNDGR